MRIRIVTLKYENGLGGFPEDVLKQAVSGHELLEAREHFFMHGNTPHLTLVLLLGDGAPRKSERSRHPDPGNALPGHLRKLYGDLRHWRNDRAKKDGIPSYVIMRNAQVAEICRKLPRTLAALKEIEGIGEATCSKYGQDILGRIPDDLEADRADGKMETPPGSDGGSASAGGKARE